MKKQFLAVVTATFILFGASVEASARNFKLSSFEVGYGRMFANNDAVDTEFDFVEVGATFGFNKFLDVQITAATLNDGERDFAGGGSSDISTDFMDHLFLGGFLKANIINTKQFTAYAKGGYIHSIQLEDEAFRISNNLRSLSYGGGVMYKASKNFGIGAEFLFNNYLDDSNKDNDGYRANIFASLKF